MSFAVFVYGPEDRSGIMGPIISRLPDADISSPLTRPERGNPSLGSPHRGKEVKIEEVTLSLARKRPGNPEPDDAAPFRGKVPEAVRGTEVPRNEVPGTAPQAAL